MDACCNDDDADDFCMELVRILVRVGFTERDDDRDDDSGMDDLDRSCDDLFLFLRRRRRHFFLLVVVFQLRSDLHRYRNVVPAVRPPFPPVSILSLTRTIGNLARREGAVPACGGSARSDSDKIVALAAALYDSGDYCNKECVCLFSSRRFHLLTRSLVVGAQGSDH